MNFSEPAGGKAELLEQSCGAVYSPALEPGLLGRRITGFERNRLYQKYDPLFGGVVLVTSDSHAELDLRPIGSKTVLECSYAAVTPGEGESGMCEIAGGQMKPLKKGDNRANARLVYRLYYTGELGVSPIRAFEWQVSREFRLQRRNSQVVLPLDPAKLTRLGRHVIQPGKTVPKFYRTDAQYWRSVTGESFAVPKGYWMQPFRDGNFHQVRTGYHMEEWPGQPEIMVEVKDDESWIKVGKGDRAFFLVEKVKRAPDWAGVYTNGEHPAVNQQISAALACRACTGNQGDVTTFEDLETVPVEFQ